jgi:coenzyme PQQ synthesis protein D (PqqD)
MQTTPLERIPRKNESIQWRAFGSDGILLDPASGDYFEINEVGLLIWTHVDGQRSIEEIIEELASHFDTDTDGSLTGDTIEFLEELIRRGLISTGYR